MRPVTKGSWVAFAVLVAVTATAGCRRDDAAGSSTAGQVLAADGVSDGLVVTFASDPNPLQKGDNTVQITVRRADGSPVTDATVTAVFSMPAMPSMNMPAMRTDAPLQHQGQGQYRGVGQLSMGGTWNVAISIGHGSDRVATRRTSVVAEE